MNPGQGSAPSPPARADSPGWGERLLWLGLVLAHLAPIWAFAYFPSQDGPSHLETVSLLFRLWSHEPGLAGQYFLLNPQPLPNLLTQGLLMGLMLLAPPLAAEKLLLSLMLVSFALAARWTLGGLDPRGRFLSILALPFFYTWTLHMGFYNFVLSLSLFLWAWGYWLRRREGFGPRQALVLGLLALALYFCHPVSLVLTGLAVGVPCLWQALLERGLPLGSRLGRTLWPLVSFAPPALMLLYFVLSHGGAAPAEPPQAGYALKSLLGLGALVSYGREEFWLYGLLAAGLWGLAARAAWIRLVRGERRLLFGDGLALLGLLCIILAVAAPDNLSGGGYLTSRLCLYPYFVLLAWLALAEWPRGLRRSIQVGAMALSLSLLVLLSAKYAQLNTYLRDYTSASAHIGDQSTLLPLSLGRVQDVQGRPLSLRVLPFQHAAGYIAAQRPVVDLGHYQGVVDHFPLVFRPGLHPYRHIGPLAGQAPTVDFATYPARTGGRVDYVLLWGRAQDAPGQARAGAITSQLEKNYDLAYTSPATGLLRLYRRRGLPDPAGARP